MILAGRKKTIPHATLAAQLSSFEIAILALVMDICHGGNTRYRAPPPTKKHRDGIIDDARANATVTADQIFTTPTSLDVYNFRASWPRDRVATHHPNGRARRRLGKSFPCTRRPRCDSVNISARKY